MDTNGGGGGGGEFLPALGRPLRLGTLYDRRSDTFSPGLSLWDPETLQQHVRTKPQPKTEFHILASDDYDSLASALHLTLSLQASLLGGKVELNGAARCLKDTKKSKNQVRVILHSYITTRFEELTMSHLGPQSIAYPGVFDTGEATHVVTAVLYGAQAFFVFDQEVRSPEMKKDVERELRACVEKLSKEAEGGGGPANDLEKLRCTFYGDVNVGLQPNTRIYSDLPKLLRENGEKAVPIKVWLHPLAKLDSRAAKLVREISTDLITRARAALEQLSDLETQCRDLVRTRDVKFPVMREKIQQFQALCKRYREILQEQLAGVVPSIRGGAKEEAALRDIVSRKELSPFKSSRLTHFLTTKAKEMDFVQECCHSLKEVDVIPSECELNELLQAHNFRFLASFMFTSLPTEEPYLLALEDWLQQTSAPSSSRSAYARAKSQQWPEGRALRRRVQEHVKLFSDFARLNKENGLAKFIVSSVLDDEYPGVSIYLYENDQLVSRNLGLPCKPFFPPVISEVTHDSVELQFVRYDREKQEWISGSRVEFRVSGQEDWKAVDTGNTEDTFLVRDLLPNTKYQFRYAFKSPVGLGKRSRESSDVKTFPSSRPGKLHATSVGSSAISIAWESPKAIAEGLLIKGYKVEYFDEDADVSCKKDWVCMTGGEWMPCVVHHRIVGLRPDTLHWVRVTAVCSDGSESAFGRATSITTLRKEVDLMGLPASRCQISEFGVKGMDQQLETVARPQEILEMPALGRPFQLGMLYDCRTDRPVPGATLWDLGTLENNTRTQPQRETSFHILSSDSVAEKASALNVPASLKASFLAGLVEVGGAAAYLKDTRQSCLQAQATLQYSTSTELRQLMVTHLGPPNMSPPEVFEQGTATHVVTAVLYGAQAFFVFRHEDDQIYLKYTQRGVEDMVQNIPSVLIGDKTSPALNDMLSCTFHGDFSLEKNPASYPEAMKICATLPKVLGEKGEKAVPVWVWLYPLSKIDAGAAQLGREISLNLILDAEAVLEQLTETDVRCSDLLKNATVTLFPEMKAKILKLQHLCKQHRQTFQKQLAQALPAIRGGRKDEGVLVDILTCLNLSPFSGQALTEFLKKKEREVNLVRSCISILKDLEVISSQNRLEETVLDPAKDFVVSFTFTSLHDEEPYLVDLEHWLQKQFQGEVPDATSAMPSLGKQESRLWFEDEERSQNIRNLATSFSWFAYVNRASGNTRFLVSSVQDVSNPGASIYLYENGCLASPNFEPPSKPLPPLIGGLKHDSVQLTFSPAAYGRASVCSYQVEYALAGPKYPHWMTVMTEEKPERLVVGGLCPNTRYRFRYSSVAKQGLSESSDERTGRTLLAKSPPHTPEQV